MRNLAFAIGGERLTSTWVGRLIEAAVQMWQGLLEVAHEA